MSDSESHIQDLNNSESTNEAVDDSASHTWEPVHVAHGYRIREAPLTQDKSWLTPFDRGNYLLSAAAGLIVLEVVYWLGQKLGIPSHILILSLGGIAILSIIVYLIHNRLKRRKQNRKEWEAARDGPNSDPNFRLRLVGDGAEANPLIRAIEKNQDTWSEPTVLLAYAPLTTVKSVSSEPKPGHKYSPAQPPTQSFNWSKRQYVVFIILFTLCMGGLYYFNRHVLNNRNSINFLHIIASGAVAYFIMSQLTPTYVRVAPGQLDILRFGWLSKKNKPCVRIDLKKARIVADIRVGSVIIYDDSDTTEPLGYVLSSTSLPVTSEKLASLVLHAARTDQPTPQLPVDSLSG